MIFSEKYECMDRKELKRLQGERLRDAARRAYENVPFYRKKFDECGVKPEHIQSLDDIVKLPFTVKDDFRQTYPFGLFAVPQREIVRVHASSGTTGKPTVVGYTREDIGIWAETSARTLACGGGTAEDVLQVAYGYGLFTGGLGLHYGGERLGAMVIPMSGGNSMKQLMLMQDFGTTLLACTPSYSLQLAEEAAAEGFDIKKTKLKAGFFGAEPWTEAMRSQIEQRLPVKAIDIYGLSEVTGPGVASECLEQHGLHVFEDHYYPEVINPSTGEPVAPGERGELVFTCLTKQAIPLIRYRTRDLTTLDETLCPCGRTSRRMARVTGRTDDMLIIRGVNVFPSQIETVLMKIDGVEPHYLIVVDKSGVLDELEIKVEVSENLFSDEVKKLEALRRRIFEELRSVLSVSPKISLVEPKSIERSVGKAKRVIDRRDLK
ncbi:MAG: phenylacetate--CoA ligase [Lentisphaerae bacterium GWF2_57_35]|nr:MAG: phenylacetate--CoA ligase [Lentisphaerae bacterium GWF2_57_35]